MFAYFPKYCYSLFCSKLRAKLGLKPLDLSENKKGENVISCYIKVLTCILPFKSFKTIKLIIEMIMILFNTIVTVVLINK